jgi:hypothetical protein
MNPFISFNIDSSLYFAERINPNGKTVTLHIPKQGLPNLSDKPRYCLTRDADGKKTRMKVLECRDEGASLILTCEI